MSAIQTPEGILVVEDLPHVIGGPPTGGPDRPPTKPWQRDEALAIRGLRKAVTVTQTDAGHIVEERVVPLDQGALAKGKAK